MTFLSPNLGHISFLQGVVIAQKYREFITTEFFSPKKTDSLNFKSIKKFNGTLRLPTNGTLNPKLRGVFFGGPWVKPWMKGRLDTGVSPVFLWGDTWLARLVTQLVPSTVGFAPDVDWVEAVLWLSPKGARTGQQQKGGSWGNDGKMKSVKSMKIFNECVFFAGAFIFFVGMLKGYTMQRKRKQSCCLVADSSLFGDTNLIKGWEWVGVTMVFLLIPAFDHIDLAIPVHLIKAVGKDTFTSSRPDVLITTQAFFCQKKPVPAPLLKKKGLHQDDEPCSILYQVAAWGVLYERPTGQKGLPAFRRSRSPGAWPQAALAFLAKVHGARRTGREAALRLGRLVGWAEGYGLMGRFWVLKTSSSMEEMMIPLFLMILMDALYIYTFSLSI